LIVICPVVGDDVLAATTTWLDVSWLAVTLTSVV
jgi:hypothetical protein